MRGHRHRLLTTSGLAGILALGAGFPAGGVSAAEYADRVCTSTTDWLEEIVDLGTEFGEDVEATSDPEEQKEVALDFLDDAVEATEGWQDEIRDAGRPDVRGGKSIARAYRKGARDTLSVLKDARAEAEDISADDADEFDEAFGELGDAIDDGLGEAGDALSEAEQDADDEYREALEDEPACEELRETIAGIP